MKKLFLILGVVAVVFCSCNKTNSLEGTYIYDKEFSNVETFVEYIDNSNSLALLLLALAYSSDSSKNDLDDMLSFEKFVIKDTIIALFSKKDSVGDTAMYSVVTENNSTKIILKDKNSESIDTILYNNEKQILDWHGLIFKRKQ